MKTTLTTSDVTNRLILKGYNNNLVSMVEPSPEKLDEDVGSAPLNNEDF